MEDETQGSSSAPYAADPEDHREVFLAKLNGAIDELRRARAVRNATAVHGPPMNPTVAEDETFAQSEA